MQPPIKPTPASNKALIKTPVNTSYWLWLILALPLYGHLPAALAADPTRFNRAVEAAQSLRLQGKAYAAIERLEQLLRHHCSSPDICLPDLNSRQFRHTQLELAQSYYQAYRYDKAIDILQQAIQSNTLPPRVVANAKQLLEKIHYEKNKIPKQTISGRMGLFTGYDNHASIGLDEDIFDYGELLEGPEHENESESGEQEDEEGDEKARQRQQSDSYHGLNVALKHQYPISNSDSWKGRALRSQINTHLFHYYRDYQTVDASDVSATSARLAYLFEQPNYWRASFAVRASYFAQDQQSLARFFKLTPSLLWFGNAINWRLQTSISTRQYQQTILTDKDGHKYLLGLQGTYHNSQPWTISSGIDLIRFNANAGYRSYQGIKWHSKAQHSIDTAWQAYAKTSYQYLDYDQSSDNNTTTRFNDQRRRRQRYHVELGSQYRFDNQMEVGIKWSTINNDDTLTTLKYDKQRLEGWFNYRF